MVLGARVGIYSYAGLASDPDVDQWVANVTSNGGSVSGQHRSAHLTFARSLKSVQQGNIWQYILELPTFCGENLESSRHRLKTLAGVTQRMAFSSFDEADYSPGAGLQCGGTRWISSGINPVAQALDLNTLGLWGMAKTGFGSGNQNLIGAQSPQTSPTTQMYLGQLSSGTREGGIIGGTLTHAAAGGSNVNYTGFMGVHNESTRLSKFYVNGTLTATSSTAPSTAAPNHNLAYGALNAESVNRVNYYTGRLIVLCITQGLPASLVSGLSAIFNQFVSDCGR